MHKKHHVFPCSVRDLSGMLPVPSFYSFHSAHSEFQSEQGKNLTDEQHHLQNSFVPYYTDAMRSTNLWL